MDGRDKRDVRVRVYARVRKGTRGASRHPRESGGGAQRGLLLMGATLPLCQLLAQDVKSDDLIVRVLRPDVVKSTIVFS